MADKLLDIQGAPLGSGVHPGLPNQSVPLWERSSNVLFEDAAVKPIPAHSSLFTRLKSERTTGILATYERTPNEPGLIWGTTTDLYDGTESDVPTPNAVTRGAGLYTGDESDLWSIAQFGNVRLATNGIDEVQYQSAPGALFVNISTVSDLPGTFRAKLLYNTGAFVIAFNTDNDPTEVRWCDEDDPLTWTPTPTNKARDILLRDLQSEIVSVVDLADVLAIVGTKQIHTLSFVGAPLFFSSRHLITGIGAVGKYACTAVGRRIYGFGTDGIWLTDGVSFQYIDTPSMHKYIYEEAFDKTKFEQVVTWQDADNNMIYWSGPAVGGGGTTVGFDWVKQVWTMHDFWRTAATSGEGWGTPISSDLLGNVWSQSEAGLAPVADPVPMLLDDSAVLTSGYGEMGYGQFGYGGTLLVDN